MKRVGWAMVLAVICGTASGSAQNKVSNSGFDSGLSGWQQAALGGYWSPVDSQGRAGSGSAVVTNSVSNPSVYGAGLISDCVAVSPGQQFTLSGSMYTPAGQDTTGYLTLAVFWYTDAACVNFAPPSVTIGQVTDVGVWVSRQGTVAAPAGTRGAQVALMSLKQGPSSSLRIGQFDNILFCLSGSCGSSADSITTPELPGYRFKASVKNGSSFNPMHGEAQCLKETLCLSGALPGRVEAQVRVIGPRNGFFWVEIVRFSTAALSFEVEQISSGVQRSYSLPALAQDDVSLAGLVDRGAFHQ